MAGQGWALSPAQCRPGDSKHGTTERRRREQQEDEVLDDARSRTDQSWIFGQSLELFAQFLPHTSSLFSSAGTWECPMDTSRAAALTDLPKHPELGCISSD